MTLGSQQCATLKRLPDYGLLCL